MAFVSHNEHVVYVYFVAVANDLVQKSTKRGDLST